MEAATTQRPDATGKRVLTVFGTRPELIKLAPVIAAIDATAPRLRSINVNTGQHRDLLTPLIRQFRVRVDHDLGIMTAGQTLNQVCSRVLAAIDGVIESEQPDLVLVQGDTSTAFAAALAAFNRRVPVGHVEAGLRSGNRLNPFPEEMNRQMVSRLATWHFAATERNRRTLRDEGIHDESIVVTGNPVVDALREIREIAEPSAALRAILKATEGRHRIVLTTHRRESFGQALTANLQVIGRFIRDHQETSLIFPVHPNPVVRAQAQAVLRGSDRVHLIAPLDYADFITLLSHAWLIVTDSGGIQEEAPTLGKPLIVLRENTERPEAVEAGVARLTLGDPVTLKRLLEEAAAGSPWIEQVRAAANPFGQGDSGPRIARAITRALGVSDDS